MSQRKTLILVVIIILAMGGLIYATSNSAEAPIESTLPDTSQTVDKVDDHCADGHVDAICPANDDAVADHDQ